MAGEARRRGRSSRRRCRRCSRRASTSSRRPSGSVLERGAVEGEIFHRGAVQALAPEETQVTPRLAALVRKELIRPDRPQLAGEDGFRFRHLLIRDAAYDALPKAIARRPPRALRRLARAARGRARRAGRDPRLPPRAGLPLPRRARAGPDEQSPGAAARPPGRRRPPLARRSDYAARSGLLERAAALCRRPRSTSPSRSSSPTPFSGAARWRPRSAGGDRPCSRPRRRRGRAFRPRILAAILRTHLEPEGAGEAARALAERALPVLSAPVVMSTVPTWLPVRDCF